MKRFIAALAFSLFTILLHIPLLSAAEFTPLPQGTVVTYNNWSFKVLSSGNDGVEVETSLDGRKFRLHSGLLFEGFNGFFKGFSVTIDAENKQKLRSLFPLAVGKSVQVDYRFDFEPANATFTVTQAQTISTPQGPVETFVINEKSTQDLGAESGVVDQEKNLWFAPSLGIVVMATLSEELVRVDDQIVFIEMPEIFFPKEYKLQGISLP